MAATGKALGRPTDRVFSVSEVAVLLEVPESIVRARLRLGGFFPGALQVGAEWRIPERAVRHCLGCKVRPLFSLETAAALLGFSYGYIHKQTATVAKLSDPLPPGRTIRALLLFSTQKRIPEAEILRLQGVES